MELHHEPVPTHAPAGMDPHSPDYEYVFTPADAGYEHTDANVWLIVKFAIWLVVSALVIHVGMWGMFYLFVEQREARQTNEFPMAPSAAQQRLPAEPRLQAAPSTEWSSFIQREQAAVNGYAWVDRNAGTVQIPIAEAMRLAVERGFATAAPAAQQNTTQDTTVQPTGDPAAQQPPATGAASPTASPGYPSLGLMPSDASSGRMMERRRQ